MREKLLHPATVISVLALLVALGGTSYAITQLPANSVGTKQLRKGSVISPKVRDGSLLARDFRTGQLPRGERGPQGLRGPQGEQGPAGEARAYAFIGVDGTPDPDRSSGIAAGNVTKGTGAAGTGFYCLSGLPWIRSAIATPAAGTSVSVVPAASVNLQVADPEQTLRNPTGCPTTGLQVIANTWDSSGNSADGAFMIWLED